MEPRRGRLIRPLLDMSREDTRAYCREHGIEWREDASNADPRFARSRIRHEVLPALGDRAEAAIVETAAVLRDEAAVLEAVVDEVVTDDLAAIAALPPALARLVLRRLADAPVSRCRAEELLALAGRGGTVALDVGGGVRAVVEYGRIRFTRAATPSAPQAVALPVPGRARFGDWELIAGADGEVALDAAALGGGVTVRAWRTGDRMRPAGLGGSKTLADLFTDRRLPRAQRPLVPVVEAAGAIAWVPGIAVGEEFRAREGAPAVGLRASRRTSG
jgi:tRNA(Ile)-lysidine synthase